MNILVIGGGGREHAFAWKIRQSPLCDQLFVAPGNAGTAELATNVHINPDDHAFMKRFCLDHQIELVVVGPEDPLVNGLADFFAGDPELKKIAFVGPKAAGAKLEGSKDHAKQFMMRHGIPTAAYQTFTRDALAEGHAFIEQQALPIVLKADGLAAGKGVLICPDYAEAKASFTDMVANLKFGEASAKVVVESFLSGIELSVFVLTDGKNYQILPAAKDYKRIGEGDTGLNTGGMGAISPVPFADAAFMKKVEERIVQPTIRGFETEGIDYKGFVFIGLMKVGDDPYVIEYNVRMGDPETEVVLPRIQNDMVELLLACAHGKLNQIELTITEQTATTVMLVAGGYPGPYPKGDVISGLEKCTGSQIFHAGTKKQGEQIVTNGGRVLAITSLADTREAALQQSFANADKIQFNGKYFRRDIGFDLA
jgi:phosphoribosylamine--glycine ligase